jgi:hypothetical protein
MAGETPVALREPIDQTLAQVEAWERATWN